MSKTYDRISVLIIQEKRRVDNAIASNNTLREKCINAITEAKLYFENIMKAKK